MTQALGALVNSFWRFFISLKLTFFLLSVIVIGAIIGMSFDQNQGFLQFFKTHSEKALYFLSFFEIYDAFHSWWFSVAILMLAANLIACSFERLPRIYFDAKNPRPYLTDRRFLGLQIKESINFASYKEAKERVPLFFQGLKPKLLKNYDQSSFFYAEKSLIARFGVYVVHISLLIIMFSAIFATQNGVDGSVMIKEGEKTRFISAKGLGGINYTYDLGFYLGCDDFRLKTFLDNTPMEFESDLYILKDNQKIVKKTIRVNEPLSYAGFNFYQSSYRALEKDKIIVLSISDKNGFNKKYRLALGEEIILPSNIKLSIKKIYDDFANLGQAVRVEETNLKTLESTFFHIFRRYPDFDASVRNGLYQIIMLDIDEAYETGVSVGYVPGISIIFFGFLLFLVGLFMCFFMEPIRYFLRIDSLSSGKATMHLAISPLRNIDNAKKDFLKRASLLKS